MENTLLGIFYKIDLIKNELLFLGTKLTGVDKESLKHIIIIGGLFLSCFSLNRIMEDEISDGFIFLFSLCGIFLCMGRFILEVFIKENIITCFPIVYILIQLFFTLFLIIFKTIKIIKRKNYDDFLELLLGMINFLVLYGVTENFIIL